MTADKRRTDACLRACEGISTKNLEDNVPVLKLARRYNALLRDNTALRAKVEAMEKQEPVAIVESWANGSYNRNYKLRWLKDAAEGANLYLASGAKGE